MEVVAIKFDDGTYYAGCNKHNCNTLLGAQLYKSECVAESHIQRSINFPSWIKEKHQYKIVKIKLEEVVK